MPAPPGKYPPGSPLGRGAPLGNQNAVKARMFRDALMRAIAKIGPGLVDGLDKLAGTVVTAAQAGEPWALQEIANRLDGKPAQALHVSGEDGGPVQIGAIEIKAVDP